MGMGVVSADNDLKMKPRPVSGMWHPCCLAIAIAPKLSLNTLLGGWLGLFVGPGCVTMSPVA